MIKLIGDMHMHTLASGHAYGTIREMAQAAAEGAQDFFMSQLGLVEQVLIETRSKDGLYEGYTMNYTPVRLKTDPKNINRILNVRLKSISPDGTYLLGEEETELV